MFDDAGVVAVLEAFDQSDSFKDYVKIPDFNEPLYSSSSLVEQVANLVRGSSTLKELNLSKKALYPTGAATIISALAESPSLENFDQLPPMDAHLYESEEVQEEIKKVIACSKRLKRVDLTERKLNEEQVVSFLNSILESSILESLEQLPSVDDDLCAKPEIHELLLKIISNSKSLKSLNCYNKSMTVEKVCEMLTALCDSESIKSLECLPVLEVELYSNAEVLPLLTKIHDEGKLMTKGNFGAMKLSASETLDLLNFINTFGSFAERLEELYMGDFTLNCTDLTGEGACDLVDSILQKAVDLKSLMLPGVGTYKDMFFEDGGCRVLAHSDKSREFLKYLSNTSHLIKKLPSFSGGQKFGENDDESFQLIIECLKKSESLKELFCLR